MNLLTQMSSFNTKDEQDVFIQGLIHAIPVRRRRPTNSEGTVPIIPVPLHFMCQYKEKMLRFAEKPF